MIREFLCEVELEWRIREALLGELVFVLGSLFYLGSNLILALLLILPVLLLDYRFEVLVKRLAELRCKKL